MTEHIAGAAGTAKTVNDLSLLRKRPTLDSVTRSTVLRVTCCRRRKPVIQTILVIDLIFSLKKKTQQIVMNSRKFWSLDTPLLE